MFSLSTAHISAIFFYWAFTRKHNLMHINNRYKDNPTIPLGLISACYFFDRTGFNLKLPFYLQALDILDSLCSLSDRNESNIFANYGRHIFTQRCNSSCISERLLQPNSYKTASAKYHALKEHSQL